MGRRLAMRGRLGAPKAVADPLTAGGRRRLRTLQSRNAPGGRGLSAQFLRRTDLVRTVRAVCAAIALGVLSGAAGGAWAQDAASFCQAPQQVCGQAVQTQCLASLGAGSQAAAGPECRTQLDAYAACLSRVALECQPGASDIGALRRSENMGISFKQDGAPVLLDRVRAGAADAFRPRLAPRPFTIVAPKSILDETPYGYVAVVAHADLDDALFRVPLAGRCWLCSQDRIWPTGGSGMADSAFGSGRLTLTRYVNPREAEGVAGFNYFFEQRLEETATSYEIFVSSIEDLNGGQHLRPGARVYLTLVDGSVVDPGEAPLQQSDVERFVLDF